MEMFEKEKLFDMLDGNIEGVVTDEMVVRANNEKVAVSEVTNAMAYAVKLIMQSKKDDDIDATISWIKETYAENKSAIDMLSTIGVSIYGERELFKTLLEITTGQDPDDDEFKDKEVTEHDD